MMRRIAILVALATSFAPADGASAQDRGSPQSRSGGVLGLMGYNFTPDGSTNAVQIDRPSIAGDDEGSPSLTLGQFGFGFRVSDSFPLYLEAYGGYARYDPRILFTGGDDARRTPLRWNNVTGTIGIGYDIRLAEYLWLRPAVLGSLGYATSDLALFGRWFENRTGIDIPALDEQQVSAWGLGGSLTLAYYDYRPTRDIDVELRGTRIELQTFGNTLPAARGSSMAQTLGLWTRLRWPSGFEAFGRPLRWVLEGSGSYYFGDQSEALGFDWSVKVGGGIEFDIGRHEIGLAGINANRVRLISRYFVGDRGVTGVSLGIGISFW